ncbi:transposase, partial [Actinotignum sanguinis]|uniref:transposase n=1 Tax=Actinotignum sanguinis TaxID=1445614 RepID=UPI003B9850E1
MTMTDVPDTANGSTADALRREFIDDDLLDRLVESSSKRGIGLTGEDGFLPELIKAVLERGMQAELTDHLGYEKHDPAGHGSGNSRNGTSPKTLQTQ